ncbi:MAG: hypothetical protein GY795_13705 [Desulfobacterales bacterium]|nr:hypothetical protein [Desulfobacterales bacterium]
MTEQNSKMRKNCRTLFPIGFGVSKVEDGIVVLNFIDIIDIENNDYEIISSIAMSEEKAKTLIKSLNEAINGNENDSE